MLVVWATLLLGLGPTVRAQITTVALYNFEDTSTVLNMFKDASGNGFHYTDKQGTDGTGFSTDVPNGGGSFSFSGVGLTGSGVNAFVTDSAPINTTTNFGIQMLFKDPASANNTVDINIVSIGHPFNTGAHLAILYDPVHDTIYGSVGGTRIGATNLGTYNTGAWNAAAVVLTGSTATFYVNGSEVASAALSLGGTPDNVSHMFVNPGTSSFYTGRADNVQFFSFANGGFNPTTALVSAVPEPSTYAALMGIVAIGLAVWRRRQQAV